MARFLLFILLLIAGWGLIFLPLSMDSGGFQLFRAARPADHLPNPWQSGASVQVIPQSHADDLDGAPIGLCPSVYVLDQGDTLGTVAHKCGISLETLLSANAQIENPNRVFNGQSVNIPLPAGRGGGGDIAAVFPARDAGFSPGAVLEVRVENMPPGARAKIGLGMSASGYRVLAKGLVGQDGILITSITIPGDAVPGDLAFVLVSAEGIPSVQVTSSEFTIGY